MPKLDGTGFENPTGKQGLECFEDAKPNTPGKGRGAGDGGMGPELAKPGNRHMDVRSSDRSRRKAE